MGEVINITNNKVEAPVQMLYADMVEVINNHIEEVDDADILTVLSQLSMQAMERITEDDF